MAVSLLHTMLSRWILLGKPASGDELVNRGRPEAGELRAPLWRSPVVIQAAFLSAIVAFWILRALYWAMVEEAPFSDMANLDAVAHGIASAWRFEWSPFW